MDTTIASGLIGFLVGVILMGCVYPLVLKRQVGLLIAKTSVATHAVEEPLGCCLDDFILSLTFTYERLLNGGSCKADLEHILANYVALPSTLRPTTDSAKKTHEAIQRVFAKSPSLVETVKSRQALNGVSVEAMLRELTIR